MGRRCTGDADIQKCQSLAWLTVLRSLCKIEVYVPESHLEAVKNAMFEVGAGGVGNYDCCSWQTKGVGQFRPLDGSKPFVGCQGHIETVIEYKLEVVCAEQSREAVVAALKQAHPYEEVAYAVIQMEI